MFFVSLLVTIHCVTFSGDCYCENFCSNNSNPKSLRTTRRQPKYISFLLYLRVTCDSRRVLMYLEKLSQKVVQNIMSRQYTDHSFNLFLFPINIQFLMHLFVNNNRYPLRWFDSFTETIIIKLNYFPK